MPTQVFEPDEQLTAIAIGYKNEKENYIADKILPYIPVEAAQFSYNEYPLEEGFSVPDTKVGRVSAPKTVDFSAIKHTAEVEDHVSFKPAGIQFEDDNNGTCFVPSRTGAVLKAKSRLVKGQSLATVNEKYDVTIMITANTGQVWMMPHAVKTAPSEMGASTGGYDIEFHSSESEEVSHG